MSRTATEPYQDDPFMQAYRGYCTGVLQWEGLAELWATLEATAEETAWYIYAVGEPLPERPVDPAGLRTFLGELDALLHREHDESYCGIVYADDLAAPSLVKVYDPNNLGSVCGPGIGPPPLPGWVLSTRPPVDLEAAMPPPANRRRWWRRLFGG